MKYFLQFEGREKLLVKCTLVALVILVLVLAKMSCRPIELYISDEQLGEVIIWLESEQNSKESLQDEAIVEYSLD